MVTFRAGTLGAARFSHDGNTVVYSGEWGSSGPREIDTFRVGSIESRDLGIPDANVAAVSSSDELAVLRTCEKIFLLDCGGTLATVDLAGGSPRDLATHVAYADWSPDGTQLMVSRVSAEGTQLEFPVGHVVLQQKTGWFGRARLSPDGTLIAFENHPDLQIDDGEIDVVDLHGNRRTLSAGWVSLEGMAWGPDGKRSLVCVHLAVHWMGRFDSGGVAFGKNADAADLAVDSSSRRVQGWTGPPQPRKLG